MTAIDMRAALEAVQSAERNEQAVIARRDLSLSASLRLQAEAKRRTVNALEIAASCAIEVGR